MQAEGSGHRDRSAGARMRLARCTSDWRRRRWWIRSAWLAAIVLPLVALAARLSGATIDTAFAWQAVFLIAVIFVGHRLTHTPIYLVAQHLDRRWPELEDSCELLLREPPSLSPLEKLQVERLARRIVDLPASSLTPDRSGWTSLLTLFAAMLVSTCITLWPSSGVTITARDGATPGGSPQIASLVNVSIEVESPAYSRQEVESSVGMNLEALQGSRLTWSIETSGPVDGVTLVKMHGQNLPADEIGKGIWQATLLLETAFLYEIHLTCGGSPCSSMGPGRIGMLADKPPSVSILSPPRVVILEPGREPRLNLEMQIELEDDYGPSSASLVWTLAIGSGESVRFRELRRPFTQLVYASGKQRIEASFVLAETDLEDGAELYYYVEAFDAREPEAQRGRSATHLLRKPGGDSTIQIATLPLDIDIMPRYLRSQRQIILDTEALIAALPNLEESDSKARSHALAFDQRALRMRYATLLGDEFSSGQVGQPTHDETVGPEAEEHDHDHEGEADRPAAEDSSFGNPGSLLAALPPGFVHMHDSEQSASILSGSVQERLRDTIAEMFDAERQLSVYDPELALPSEYRALHKLKQAQEADRLYVRRVGFSSSPLESEERRFQGELDEIRDRSRERLERVHVSESFLWQSLTALEAWMKIDRHPTSSDAEALAQARSLLAEEALGGDGMELESLRALIEIETSLERSIPLECSDCLEVAIRGLLGLLPEPPLQPDSRNVPSKLERRYREARP